jgi:N-acetylglutamate synthase-like GNAT family acetyltransferase
MENKIRVAQTDDIPALVILVESVYRGESSKQGWTTEADLLDGQRTDPQMIQELMFEENSLFYLVEDNSKKLCASVYLQKEKEAGYIGMLAVRTDCQNQKLGKVLLSACEKKIKEWGLKKARMTVLEPRVELMAWYERQGFQKTGNEEEFPTDPRFGRPKVQGLKLLELIKNL